MNTIEVSTGMVRMTRSGGRLQASALGSCIAVLALCPAAAAGAVAHVMLPGRAPRWAREENRYAWNAVTTLFKRLTGAVGTAADLVVCTVGGGNVLKRADDTVCQANITSVREAVRAYGCSLAAEEVGGFSRRRAGLDAAAGTIWYAVNDLPVRTLWSGSAAGAACGAGLSERIAR